MRSSCGDVCWLWPPCGQRGRARDAGISESPGNKQRLPAGTQEQRASRCAAGPRPQLRPLCRPERLSDGVQGQSESAGGPQPTAGGADPPLPGPQGVQHRGLGTPKEGVGGGLQVSDAILENARLMLQTENVQGNAEDFKERYESEESLRKEVQDEIGSLYKVIDDADLTKAELQGQMDDMKAELRSLEHKHEQDVRVLYSHMAGGEPDQPDSPIETSLDRILAYVRDHWEEATERNRAEAHGDQECKAQCVSSRLSPEEEQVEALRLECSDAGGQIQRLQADMESMRALKRGLKNSLSDAKHWHHVELQNVGSVVAKLEAELADVRGEIEQQRYDYDTLLSNKRRLEQEIGLYHGILDREESRVQPAELLAATAPDCRTKAPGPGPGPAEP
ncbi:phakinin isoform X2 [Genypterus blacodes]|uniref:phakinin isoform X2 n=1 Tax=Genypterus blacodes TaxID=154954 RepID=UPI003F768ABE